MPNSNPTSKQPSLPRQLLDRLILAIAAFGFIGFADSAYLTADHYYALPLPCTITHGCETVLTSKYAVVGPVPLAVFGVIFYLVVFFIALSLYTSEEVKGKWVNALFVLGGIGLVMSIIFESMQVFLIHAICQYCALSALCSLLLFIFGMWLLRVSKRQ